MALSWTYAGNLIRPLHLETGTEMCIVDMLISSILLLLLEGFVASRTLFAQTVKNMIIHSTI